MFEPEDSESNSQLKVNFSTMRRFVLVLSALWCELVELVDCFSDLCETIAAGGPDAALQGPPNVAH